MKKQELVLYGNLLSDIKLRVRQGQQRAALSTNAEMILTYWDIGRMISQRQSEEGWGAGVIPRLAADLKNELPEEKGFSMRNLGNMVRFYREYGDPQILQQSAAKLNAQEFPQTLANMPAILQQVAAKSVVPSRIQEVVLQIPWYHNVILMQKIKDPGTRLWYVEQTVMQGWNRDNLLAQIKSAAHERQGNAVTNFSTTLPPIHAATATSLLKDPYVFDFLTMEELFHDRSFDDYFAR